MQAVAEQNQYQHIGKDERDKPHTGKKPGQEQGLKEKRGTAQKKVQ
jgi:hypothetical protein